MTVPAFHEWFHKYWDSHVRAHERHQFLASSSLLIAMFIVILGIGEFGNQKEIAVVSLLFICIGDVAAAIVGKSIGSIPIGNNKSLEGSLGFLVSGSLAAMLVPAVEMSIWIPGIIAATLLEWNSGPLNDNFSVPIGAAFVMWGSMVMFV